MAALILCGACLFAGDQVLAQEVPRFRLTDLGLPADGAMPKAYAINAKGQITGEFLYKFGDPMQAYHAFVWLPKADYGLAAGMHDLTDLAGLTAQEKNGVAFDINDDGIVVGRQDTATLSEVAFLWDLAEYPNGWAYDLRELGSGGSWDQLKDGSTAHGVNNASPAVIVGVVEDGVNPPLGFQITMPFGMQDAEFETLAPLLDSPEDETSCGYDVNMSDPLLVVGRSSPWMGIDPDCNNDVDAVMWESTESPGPARELPGIGDFGDSPEAEGLGTNEAGLIVGWGDKELAGEELKKCFSRALFWEEVDDEIEVTNLGALVGGSPNPRQSRAEAIRNTEQNEPLQVVGSDTDHNIALLWERDSGNWSLTILFEDDILDCFGWDKLYSAKDINDDGWITGSGRDGNNHWRAYVLTTPSDCPADVNWDRVVDIDDVFDVLAHWGDCPIGAVCTWDLDYNCIVDVDDLFLVLNGWTWGPCEGDGGGGGEGQGLAAILNDWLADGGADALDKGLVTWDDINGCLTNESENSIEDCLYGLLKE